VDGNAFAGDGFDAELLPVEELADCAASVLAGDGKRILSYGPGAGYTPLRELIAEWFGVHPRRVLVTNGSLQGLGLLARQLAQGRPVVAEYPVNERMERTLLDAGAVLTSVEIDAAGLNVAELRQQLAEYRRPVLIYTIPSFHNPTGYTMAVDRRRFLVELVRAHNERETEGIVLVEDDAYGLTRFEGERLPALFDLSAKTAVYSSSFSTTIAPGLRVGWLILPDALAVRLAEIATATYITPALLGQATAYEFIRRGSFEPHLTRLRESLKLRRDALLDALAEHFPDGTWSRPEGGFFVWLELPAGTDTRPLVERAQLNSAVPGTAFASTANALRLSYAGGSPEEVAAGVERLATARAEQAAQVTTMK
jgi:2-aminoadipate transaminase